MGVGVVVALASAAPDQAQMSGPRQWWLAPDKLTIPIGTAMFTDSNTTIDDGIVFPDFSITS
jgi:hypothetical protein